MGNIFISYRRGDSIATAGRIRDRLVQEFGRPNVFVDVDDIPHGQDFVKVLSGKVAECDVLLAIIGPHWVEARDEKGQRRLELPDDFVGIEIGTALARESIAVIPVLVDGAQLPTVEQLPAKLKPLARRNAIELRNTQFGSDAERLIRSIRAALPRVRGISLRTALLGAVVLGLLGGGFVAWPSIEALMRGPGGQPPTAPSIQATQKQPPAPGSRTDAKADVAAAIAQLRKDLGQAEGRVDVGLRGGRSVKLGDQIIFEITSRVPGRLILVDINAAGEVTQIFPNRFLANEAAAMIGTGVIVNVPGPGYGFSGFKAVEPTGRGQLIALVVPESAPLDRFAQVIEQRSKGFEPVNAPGAYITQIVEQARALARANGAGAEAWAFAIADYEIVR